MVLTDRAAGVMACPEGTTQDGHEMHFGVNYLAHVYLFELLKPSLLAASSPAFQSRVVVLTSNAHRVCGVDIDDLHMKKRGYSPYAACGQVCLQQHFICCTCDCTQS